MPGLPYCSLYNAMVCTLIAPSALLTAIAALGVALHLAGLQAQAEASVEAAVDALEYLIDERTSQVLFYDINALSNFVADAVNVVGFDPYARFVDYLETQLPAHAALAPAAPVAELAG